MKRFIALCLAALVVAGCGSEPGVSNIRQTYPAVRIKAVKSILGAAADLSFTSDFHGTGSGRWNKTTGDFEFDVLMDSNVSGVLPNYTAWGTAVMLPSQKLDNEWHENLRASILKGLELGLQYVSPLVSQYIGAWQSVTEKRLMSPSLITQAAGVLAAAKSGGIPFDPVAIWSAFGPELKAALQKLAPSAVPTSQPSH